MACASMTGCVRRRLTIRSNPAGAVAFVDDRRIGVTPVSTPFTYYGTRKVQLFKDGYEPLTVQQRMRVPWYEYPGLDIVSEILWPFEIRDEHAVEFDMMPQQIVPNEQLLQRGEELRMSSNKGVAAPLFTPPAQPVGLAPSPVSRTP